jgi:diguanylate cyclase (GGDEF)-like protein
MARTQPAEHGNCSTLLPGAWEVLAGAARMTRHMERARLDQALVSTLAELWQPNEIRLYQTVAGPAPVCRQIMTLCGGTIVHQEHVTPENDERLDAIAGAEDALASRCVVMTAADDTTAALLLPVCNTHDQPVRLLQLSGPADRLQRAEPLIRSLLDLYENHLNLIDDSERDTLTGLRNRRTFDHLLANLLSGQAPVDQSPTGFRRSTNPPAEAENWLAVLDIDNFKAINDRFGHLFGDEVLILVANLMQKCFRAHDPLFRFGGEEFVIVLCGVDRSGASKAVERFRVSLENQQFPQVGQITISTGYTTISEGQLSSEVLNRADAALYYAKENGRNRSCCYEALVEEDHIAPLQRSIGSGFELF